MARSLPKGKLRVAMIGLRTIGRGSGGVERAVEEIGVRLVRRGHEVTVFCRGRYNRPRLGAVSGVRLLDLPAIYTKHLEAISHTTLAVCRAAWGFDVVHLHAVGPSLLAFVPRLAGRRVVVTVHAFDWRREKWGQLARGVLRLGGWCAAHLPHETIVVSRVLRGYFEATYGAKPTYIPNGAPGGERRPPDLLRHLGVEGQDYVLFLGRLVPEKGCHILLEAFRELATDVKLLIVGEATHTEDYARRLRRSAEGDARVIFAGPLFGPAKEAAYANALCLAFPSTLEGMPIVLLEAMSLGCPVLCSDIPENLEVVTPAPGVEGEVAPPLAALFRSGSSEDLRAGLRSILDSPAAARARADRAVTFANQAYSWESIVDQTEAVYHGTHAHRLKKPPNCP